jgi:Siphovirus ReqiPepy6 Gp37-like protein
VEPFTLNRQFLEQDVIDGFESAIWTERYYGDSDVELIVPATKEMINKLPTGVFLGLRGSDEIMIVETINPEGGNLKVSGIALLPWLNNRFIRASADHEDQYWAVSGVPGYILWAIVFNMCCQGSPYLNGTIPIGIPNPQDLVIPGLGLKDYDKAGDSINVGVPFGPVYDAMREIATTYKVGMQITLESATDTAYSLGFRSYRGLDHTSGQTVNTVVRFSPQMDSLTNIKELSSIAALKTRAYTFVPTSDAELKALITGPGIASRAGSQYTGFDLRALLIFANDITTNMVAGSSSTLLDILNSRARDGLDNNRFIQTVDGEIVPSNQFQYGIDYNLGDMIEVQGNSGVVQRSRVTEYIRAQDEAGERAYPTVALD